MTRDEYRVECVEAMKTSARGGSLQMNGRIAYISNTELIELFTVAFDSLHGIARVEPIEPTEEMIGEWERVIGPRTARKCFKDMSAAGDLTNLPGGKP